MKTSWGPNTNWNCHREFVAVLLLLSLPPVARAARDGLEVRLTSGKALETEPGKIVTASFLVSNTGNRDEEFIETVRLPAGWQKIAPADAPFTIEAGQEQVRVLALAVPVTAASDRYPIVYRVTSRRDYNRSDAADFEVRVLPVAKLELLVEDKPAVVIAGDEYEVGLRLVNRGNTTETVRLEIASTPNFPVTNDTSEVILAPASTQKLRLRVKTDGALKDKVTHILGIRATGAPPQTVGVEVIPTVTGERDPYWRLPTQLRLIATAEKGESVGFQAEYSGAGSLDEAGQHRVDFLFRGPDIQDNSVFGLREEYRLSYFQENFDAHVGDRAYFLSPLLERGAYGRGAEFNAHPGPLGAGAFYMESLWSRPDFQELGAYVKDEVTDWLSVKADYLRRWGNGHPWLTNAPPQDLYGVESFLKLGAPAQLHLEGGLSEDDYAYRAQLRGRLADRLDYAVERLHAGPDFFGYYNDVDATYAAFGFPIWQKLRGTFSFQQYDKNLDRDPLRSSVANREIAYRPGLRYTFPFGTDVSVEYYRLDRRDALAPADYDFTENSVRLGLGHSFQKIGLQLYVDRGQLDNHLTGRVTGNLERYSAYVYYRPTPRQSYSLFASTGFSQYSGAPERGHSVGGSAWWLVQKNLAVNAQVAHDTTQDTGNASGGISYTLPNQHNLTLSARWTHDKQQDETAAMLTYTIPLGLPVGRKKSVGALKGKVFDADYGDKIPLQRVIVLAGHATAVTDRDGEFVFPSLPPGEYLLRVEQRTIGQERTTVQPLPARVEVQPGRETQVAIGVVTAARMVVTVPGCQDVMVELSDGREVLRQVTDRRGQATFEQLRPGRWTMSVADGNLPAWHYIESPSREFRLRPGETQTVAVNVLERHRPIQIIDQGVIASR